VRVTLDPRLPVIHFFISIVESIIAEIAKRGHRDILNRVSTVEKTQYNCGSFIFYYSVPKSKIKHQKDF